MKFILIFLFSISVFPLAAVDDIHKLLVNGQATLHMPVDTFMLKIGVVTMEKNAVQAMEANNEKMQEIIAALQGAGLAENEFQTGNFTVAPKYTQPPKNTPPEWQPSLVGYEVRNTLSIQTNKLEHAGSLIDAAAKEGANLFEDISFTLQESEDAYAEAITRAVRQARVYAKAAVKESGVKLGDILEIAINPTNMTPHYKFAMAALEIGTPIIPGYVEITSSVSVTYELKNQ